MYQKEVNQRSPLRVFERSMHGGLGKGNIGVVMSRPGVGKTAVLVGIALDDLMREKKVLHINIDDPVEKVRAFYDEVFYDLAEKTDLAERGKVHLSVERHRMIQTYQGGSFSLDKLKQALEQMREHMQFVPEAIVIDGFPKFSDTAESEMQELKKIAVDLGCEMWLTAMRHRDGEETDDRGVPTSIAKYEEYISVLVNMTSESDHVRLHLIKDHDNRDVANLQIELDPKTLLLKWS